MAFITHQLADERRVFLREGLIDAFIDQNPELEVRTAVGVIAAYFGRLEGATAIRGDSGACDLGSTPVARCRFATIAPRQLVVEAPRGWSSPARR